MSAPLDTPALRLNTRFATGIVLAGTLALAGCAQQRSAGYYDPPGASTITDAQYQGQAAGYRTVVHAPSQLQIELKPNQPARQQNAQPQAQAGQQSTEDGTAVPEGQAAPQPQPETASPGAQAIIPQAQTYQGTFPCFAAGLACEAQRVTLTLAPNGRWRSRTNYLDKQPQASAPVAEQGCWDATQERPPRVLLLDGSGNMRAELVMTANNVLRVRSVGGRTPNLNYNLTRQPDLDAIAELDKQAAPKCP